MHLARPRSSAKPIQPRATRAASGHLLDEPDLVRIRDEDAARDLALEPFSPAARERWKRYCLGAVVFFPILTWFFTPSGFQMLWFQILVSAAYGTFIAFQRPTGILAILSTICAGYAIQAVTGHGGPGFGLIMSLLVYGIIGAFVGIGESSRLVDGK